MVKAMPFTNGRCLAAAAGAVRPGYEGMLWSRMITRRFWFSPRFL
jgi:hypothetical protein